MEPRFVDFIAANGDDVRVNASKVLFVAKGMKDARGEHAEIVFGPGQSLMVNGTVEQVTMKLMGKPTK
jgi:hypothetical protein